MKCNFRKHHVFIHSFIQRRSQPAVETLNTILPVDTILQARHAVQRSSRHRDSFNPALVWPARLKAGASSTLASRVACFCRRHARLANQHCKAEGWWSLRGFQRAVAWQDHLLRPHNLDSWAAQLEPHQNVVWFNIRHAFFDQHATSEEKSCVFIKLIYSLKHDL